MRTGKNGFRFWLIVLAYISAPGILMPSFSRAAGVEEALSGINRLSPKEREAKLIAGAKKEGSLIWYGNIEAVSMGKFNEQFQKKYPFLKATYWRGSGVKLVNRVILESKNKSLEADAFFLPFESFGVLKKQNILGRYLSPELGFYGPEHRDRDGYWASTATNYASMAYNTKSVPRSQIPRSYEELLNPKWSGAVSIDMEPDRALFGWLKVWGEKKTESFLRGLIKNKAIVRRGHTLQAQLLCAGEFQIATELYMYRVAEMKAKGCPIDIIYADPISGAGTPAALARTAAHPHAAALFMDFILSEEGQKVIADSGRIPSRKGVKAKYEEISHLEEKGVSVVITTPEDEEKWRGVVSRLINEILK